MSLDALAEELRRFEQALTVFSEVLRSTEHERVIAEERARGLGEDSFRQEFVRRHAHYAAPVADFTERGVERYTSFIALKRHQVEEYLRAQ